MIKIEITEFKGKIYINLNDEDRFSVSDLSLDYIIKLLRKDPSIDAGFIQFVDE